MAVNMAVKRARKAQRRKQAVAQKRRAEGRDTGLAARAVRGAHAPVRHCFITESLFDSGLGIGTLVLARGATPYHLVFGTFLLDVFCLGIKDVMVESAATEVFETYMDAMDEAESMVSIDPNDARKLLRDLAAWSRSIGFAPHADFAAAERIFGDISADASDAKFEFGRDGKPVYIPGPYETPSLIRRRIEQVQKHLGDDGFEFETAA
jgi:hypothetical protein